MATKTRMPTTTIARLLLIAFALACLAPTVLAAGGTDAPWNSTIVSVAGWFTGNTGKMIITIGFAFAVYGIVFSEGGTVWRKVGYASLGAGVFGVIGNLMDKFMGGGGVLV